MHGLEVLRKLRGRGNSTPVLILTAADSVEQRVKGLDLGADDYMAKPFSLQELEARVRALTRRGLGTASTLIKHGPLTFDATGRVAYINDQMIELSARELSLLEVLLQRAGAWSARISWSSACASGARKSRTTRSRSISTACARRLSKGRCASRPCVGWATAWRRSPPEWRPRARRTATTPRGAAGRFGAAVRWPARHPARALSSDRPCRTARNNVRSSARSSTGCSPRCCCCGR